MAGSIWNSLKTAENMNDNDDENDSDHREESNVMALSQT